MFIKRLELKNFRNYKETEIDFNSKKILFIGKNAQGKTNLLEAVYYIATLDSFRAKTENELITWGENFCRINANINKFDIETELEIKLSSENRKKLTVNGINKNKISEFTNNINTVSFSVNDLLLLRGTPDDRRKWLDSAISSIYSAYRDRLLKYNKIRIQKNNCLKNYKGAQNGTMLNIWNEQLAIAGSNISFIRINFLHELQKIAKLKHSQISNNENLILGYNSSVIGEISAENKFTKGSEYIMDYFMQKLEEKKEEEIIRGQSLVGAHRDDVSIYINERDAKKYASQGQQRTVVLALKLGELEIINDKISSNAILLLDDVLAELDDLRQNYLLNSIPKEAQTIITSVDTLQFREEYLKDVEIFEIKNNEVVRSGFTYP